jgi:hypothetical protein
MSMMGVPSIASSPRTRRDVPSTEISSTKLNPTGLGRCGHLQANMPTMGTSGFDWGLWSPWLSVISLSQ